MRRLAHISDLHFGAVNRAAVEALKEELRDYGPHLVAVTGDLTQRARPRQMRAARRFLDELPFARVVVPGNHDLAPFFDPVGRLLWPHARYQRFVSGILEPSYDDAELLVMGLNTAAPLRRKEGQIHAHQIERVRRLGRLRGRRFFVLVSHHPVVGPAVGPKAKYPRGGAPLIDALEDAGVHLALAGHLHESFHGTYAVRMGENHSVLVVQASTATSTRLRGHANAYNRILIEPPCVTVEVRIWDGHRFSCEKRTAFRWEDGVVRAAAA